MEENGDGDVRRTCRLSAYESVILDIINSIMDSGEVKTCYQFV